MYTNLRLKIRDFFKRNKSKIIIIFIIWLVIFIINLILKNWKTPVTPITTYQPHTAVLSDAKVPEKLQTPIENLIDVYIRCCNHKEYEKAYSLLSDDCKNNLYKNIDEFKLYIDNVFDGEKVYYIQNYSNIDDIYIYEVNILDDILATGLTGSEELEVYSEKFVIKDNNGKLTLSIREYIGSNENYQVYEDEYIKVEIQEMTQSYEYQTYKLKLTNRTDNIIVLADFFEKDEIVLELENQNRQITNLYNSIYLDAYKSEQTEFKFVKFVDEKDKVKSMVFNNVRVLKSYTGLEETRQEELDNAVKIYGFSVEL